MDWLKDFDDRTEDKVWYDKSLYEERMWAKYEPLVLSTPDIEISEERYLEIQEAKVLLASVKVKEYNRDPKDMEKRWETGLGGECAIEEVVGRKFVDFSVGRSFDYCYPDLQSLGYRVGVKTSSWGAFPLIKTTEDTDQIIVVKKSDRVFHVLGILRAPIPQESFDKRLVRNSTNQFKSGFFRFDLLEPISDAHQRSKIET